MKNDTFVVNSQHEKVQALFENESYLFRELIRVSENAVALFNEDGDFIYLNQEAQILLGVQDGRRAVKVNLFDFIDDIDAAMKLLLNRQKVVFNTSFGFIPDTNPNTPNYYSVRISAIFNGDNITAYVGILSDITDYTETTSALRSKTSQLIRLNAYIQYILRKSDVSLWRLYGEANRTEDLTMELLLGKALLVKENNLKFKDLLAHFEEHTRIRYTSIIQRIIDSDDQGLIINDSFELQTPNGPLYLRHTFVPAIIDNHKEILCVVHNATVIMTQQKETERSNFKSQLLIGGGGLVPWEYNVRERRHKFDKRIESIGTVADINDFLSHVDKKHRPQMQSYYDKMDQGVDFTVEIDYTYFSPEKDEPIYFKTYFTPYIFDKNGKVAQYVGYTKNITETTLLIDALDTAKQNAEKADRLKSQFLANMSHEIRTPLNAIVGFSEMISYARSPEEMQKWQKHIYTNSDMLLMLINDILDLSKIESGNMKIVNENFDFSKFFNELAINHKSRLSSTKVNFIVSNDYSSLIINSDKGRIAQIINNYVTNAIKHTSEGYIKLGYELIDDNLKIYVEDTGKGISPENQKKLFARFEKLDDTTQGTGLGLAIIKAMVTLMNGTCGCVSSEGKGSLFWASIPVDVTIAKQIDSKSKQIEEPITNTESIPIKRAKILVAEDNESNFILLKSMLEGFDITHAYNGIQAIELLKVNTYDAIIMDIRMPELSGDDAITQIRLTGNSTPIIVATANAFDSDRQYALQIGANDFLCKPIRRTTLLNILSKYI